MSTKTNEEIATRLLAHPGILAVRVQLCGYPSDHFDAERPEKPIAPRAILDGAMEIFAMFGYREPLRVIAGDPSMTISCYCDCGIAVVVIAPTGHGIQKSMRRMVQRTISPGRPRRSKIRTIVERAVKPGDAA